MAMKKSTKATSLGKIARLAGVSTASVSYALQNQPGISQSTRERILRIAKNLGYAPDARIVNWMARVRDAKSKDLLPIAWLNTAWQKEAWKSYLFHTPFIEGARARALELGYRIEDIWAHEPGMTMQRLAKILYQRGIEGVIVTHPAKHARLNWDHLACVTLGAALQAPRLHRVTADLNYNLQLAIKSVKRLGYRRIGICMTRGFDSASHFNVRAMARDLHFSTPAAERVPPLFHRHLTYYELLESQDRERKTMEAEMVKWLKRYKPEVIIGHDSRYKQWAEAAGFRVPEDIGVVHLAVDDDVLDWAGIHSHRREIGATTVEWLVSLMRNHQFGVPKTPLNILVRGSWQNGKTLTPHRLKAKKEVK
jgi:LacI family transcriptional regulator